MNEAAFVSGVMGLYRRFAGPHVRPRCTDRRLAAVWRRRGLSLETIENAMLLARARRLARPAEATPLQPIRSLHYFIPVLAEVTTRPLADHYVAHLRSQLAAGRPVVPAGARPDFDTSR